MALVQERKQELVSKFKRHDTDTGSPEVQVALITERIASRRTRRTTTAAAGS